MKDSQPPWIEDKSAVPPWAGFEKWCIQLNKEKRPWESQKIFRALLKIVPEETAARLFSDFIDTLDDNDSSEAVIVAKLAAINAYGSYLLRHLDSSGTQQDFSIAGTRIQDAQSLLVKLFRSQSNMKGRQYHEWRLNVIKFEELSGASRDIIRDKLEIIRMDAERELDYPIQIDCHLHECTIGHVGPNITQQELFQRLEGLWMLQMDILLDSVGYARSLQDYADLVTCRAEAEVLAAGIISASFATPASLLTVVETLLGSSPVREVKFDVPSLKKRNAATRLKIAELQNDEQAAEGARRLLAKFDRLSLLSFRDDLLEEPSYNDASQQSRPADGLLKHKPTEIEERRTRRESEPVSPFPFISTMTGPIGITSRLSALASFAFQSSLSLCQVVESFQSNKRIVRELREELAALNGVLQSLQEATANNVIDLLALRLPLLLCGQACREFEAVIVNYTAHSGGSRTSFQDWAKLTYMGDDMLGFKNMLGEYKSTISITLADANLYV
jgi:hypothetical protein